MHLRNVWLLMSKTFSKHVDIFLNRNFLYTFFSDFNNTYVCNTSLGSVIYGSENFVKIIKTSKHI